MVIPTIASLCEALVRACSECESENLWNRRYCRSCGHKIVKLCEVCQFLNSLGDLFCGGCGSAMAPEQVESQARVSSSMPKVSQDALESSRQCVESQDLAKKLADLNTTNVQQAEQRQPEPATEGADAAESEDLGQDQVDAIFR